MTQQDGVALVSLSRPTFDDVYARTFRSVYATAKRLGVRAHALDDLVQDVFVVVFRQLDDYEARGSVWSWVFGIVLRVVSNYRRIDKRKGAGRALSSVVEDADALVASIADSPLERLVRSEASLIFEQVLARMSGDKADILLKCDFCDYTVVEVAERLQIPVNTAYSRLRQARTDFTRLADQISRDRVLVCGEPICRLSSCDARVARGRGARARLSD